jgi:hypothetical protein
MEIYITRMKHNSIILSMLLFLSLSFSNSSYSQINQAIIANADTSNFSPNRQGNWVLYNSYVAKKNDGSTDFEVIVQHYKEGIDWGKEQLIGKIKNQNLFPLQDKDISYDLLGVKYAIHISKSGACFLNLVSGPFPDADPVIIPVQVSY